MYCTKICVTKTTMMWQHQCRSIIQDRRQETWILRHVLCTPYNIRVQHTTTRLRYNRTPTDEAAPSTRVFDRHR